MAKTSRILLKVIAVGFLLVLFVRLSSRVSYPMDRVDPRSIRDAGWASLKTPETSPDCLPYVETYDEDWPQAKTDPTFLNGGSVFAVKTSWCSGRHVRLSVTYHSTNFSAWRRVAFASRSAGSFDIATPPDSHLDFIQFTNAGTGDYKGKNWSYCSSKMRMGNYIVLYHLDTSDTSSGCESLARQDVQSIREALDALIDTRGGGWGIAPLQPEMRGRNS